MKREQTAVHHKQASLYQGLKLQLHIYLCTASAKVSHTEMVWHMAGIICKREREREKETIRGTVVK